MIDEDSGRRRSALTGASEIAAGLIDAGFRTIVFTRGRKSTELVYRAMVDRLPGEKKSSVAPYRAGYTPAQRRQVEQRLFGGELAGVVATNALELGIDVGGLDAAVIVTFPGTLAAFRQQTGRAGRARQESLAVLIAGEDALDQYLMTSSRGVVLTTFRGRGDQPGQSASGRSPRRLRRLRTAPSTRRPGHPRPLHRGSGQPPGAGRSPPAQRRPIVLGTPPTPGSFHRHPLERRGHIYDRCHYRRARSGHPGRGHRAGNPRRGQGLSRCPCRRHLPPPG